MGEFDLDPKVMVATGSATAVLDGPWAIDTGNPCSVTNTCTAYPCHVVTYAPSDDPTHCGTCAPPGSGGC